MTDETQIDEELEQEQASDDATQDEAAQETTAEPEAEAAPEEVTVTIGDEQPEEHEQAPGWIREVRQRNRELNRELRQAREELERVKGGAPAAVVVGAEPTLEEHDYDAEKYAAALKSWVNRKAAADRQEQERKDAERKQQEAWAGTVSKFEKAKAALAVPDYDDAQEAVKDHFSQLQQNLLLKAPRAAELVYALGKSDATARRLAAIQDPVEFVYEAAEVMKKLNVQPARKAPIPERKVSVGGGGAIHGDARMAELRRKAEATGDYSAYFEAKRKAKA